MVRKPVNLWGVLRVAIQRFVAGSFYPSTIAVTSKWDVGKWDVGKWDVGKWEAGNGFTCSVRGFLPDARTGLGRLAFAGFFLSSNAAKAGLRTDWGHPISERLPNNRKAHEIYVSTIENNCRRSHGRQAIHASAGFGNWKQAGNCNWLKPVSGFDRMLLTSRQVQV